MRGFVGLDFEADFDEKFGVEDTVKRARALSRVGLVEVELVDDLRSWPTREFVNFLLRF